MKHLLQYGLIKLLSIIRAFPTGMSKPVELRALLESLHPRTPDQKLIRLGPMGDGGYLVPDDLAGIQACFSPGVSFVSGFEKDCADLGMQVFLADKSVDQPADQHEKFHFTKKYLGVITDDSFMTLEHWVNSSLPGSDADLMLQADIEGYEYEVFLSASEALMKRFRVIVAEFHVLDQLFSAPFFQLARRAFEKILQTHVCVHIHPNNYRPPIQIHGISIPKIMEFTFVRKDRVHGQSYQNQFPHDLDCDNSPNPSVVLPKCWFLQSA